MLNIKIKRKRIEWVIAKHEQYAGYEYDSNRYQLHTNTNNVLKMSPNELEVE